MKEYRLIDPSGNEIKTVAKSLRQAKTYFTNRLTRQPYGMFVLDAKRWAEDTKEMPE